MDGVRQPVVHDGTGLELYSQEGQDGYSKVNHKERQGLYGLDDYNSVMHSERM